MAVEVCSDIPSLGNSPRISFSHDLNNQSEIVSVNNRSDSLLLDPNFDFDFWVGNSFATNISPADELFSDGKILPIEIKNQEIQDQPTKENPRNEPIRAQNTQADSKKKRLKEFLYSNFDGEEEEKPDVVVHKPAIPKPFWQFRRSSSLNFENVRGKSLIKSLQFLSRSNSTGSAPNQKQETEVVLRGAPRRSLMKQTSVNYSRSSSTSSSSGNYYPYNSQRRPPLKKNCRSNGGGGGGGGGVRIIPVLNIPHNCIPVGTVNLFGLSSFFSYGKAKKKNM